MRVTMVQGDLPGDLAAALRAERHVAVDTETSGLDWARDALQLCAIYSPSTGPIILRHVSRYPVQLADLMGDPNVVKVLHFAPFDLAFIEHAWGVRARTVACTKAASRLLTPGAPSPEHSLQALLRNYLSVQITKGTVRTSYWGAPALSEKQVRYVAGDVTHLIDLFEVLGLRLDAQGLTELFWQVCDYMPVEAHLRTSGIPDPFRY